MEVTVVLAYDTCDQSTNQNSRQAFGVSTIFRTSSCIQQAIQMRIHIKRHDCTQSHCLLKEIAKEFNGFEIYLRLFQ